jgi:hypothetical protein
VQRQRRAVSALGGGGTEELWPLGRSDWPPGDLRALLVEGPAMRRLFRGCEALVLGPKLGGSGLFVDYARAAILRTQTTGQVARNLMRAAVVVTRPSPAAEQLLYVV